MVTVNEALDYIACYCNLRGINYGNFYASMERMEIAAEDGIIPPFTLANGCTKGVVIFDDADFVVKIPFRDYNGYPFRRALSATKWDYCLREVEIYAEAVKSGVEIFLAETRFVGKIHTHPVYVQDRIENIANYGLTENFDSTPKINQQVSRLLRARTTSHSGFYGDLVALMIGTFGFRRTQRFMNLCAKMNTGSDWHCGNYGTTFAGRLIFCDYTGFRD